MKYIDNLLDQVTMYRLILYYLIFLVMIALVFSLLGALSFSPISLIISVALITGICWITNFLFSKAYDAPTNVESVYISALILILILQPIQSVADLPLIIFASVLTMATKYILALHKKHLFNPVAIAIVLTAVGFGGSASWWIGTAIMLPASLLGILIVRKIRRFDLVFYFFFTAAVAILGMRMIQGGNVLTAIRQVALSSPIFFFAFIMLTEPLTTPPTKKLQILYGAVVGVLFSPQLHIGSFYTTPEIALVLGNIFSYAVSPKYKIMSTVKEKIQTAPNMMDFVFAPEQKLSFTPGQYMEWTLPHKHPDSRGNRRYLTIASSPTEDTVRLGVKFYPQGSSFKKALAEIDHQTPMVGAQLSGDFTMPKDVNQKLVFIAGGIGVTPFRSMLKFLVDTKQSRPIVLFYANKTADEIVYVDVFNDALTQLGIKTVYTLTDKDHLPPDWHGRVGRIDAQMMSEEVPDFMERIFYLSGPHQMVTAYEETLKAMGVPVKQIKIDYFPGFA